MEKRTSNADDDREEEEDENFMWCEITKENIFLER